MRHLSSSFMWIECLPECSFLDGPPLMTIDHQHSQPARLDAECFLLEEYNFSEDEDDDDEDVPEAKAKRQTRNERKTHKVRRWVTRRLQKSKDNEWRWERFNLINGSLAVLAEVREAYQRR